LYRLLQAIGFPLLLLYLLRRIRRDRRYANKLSERFGFLPFQATQRGGIWLHAVSVGEVLSLAALLRQLRAKLPGTPLYVSVTTVAGREMAEQRLRGLADGIFHAPLDYAWVTRRVLRQLDPLAVVILETEIWPNLWNETRRRDAALLVLNGRISDAAWPRYRAWRWAFAPVLRLPFAIYAQSERDAERYRELGAASVRTAGNLKYDIAVPPPAPALRDWLAAQRADKVVIAASTMPAVTAEDREEDDVVLDAFTEAAREFPRLLMILAPRRPELFAQAAAKLAEREIRFARRSALENIALPGVLLLDSMGELAGLFELADAVFVGGSLVHWGGHNVLEPAASGRAILVGPHMQNFAAIAAEFRAAGALIDVPAPAALGGCLMQTLREPGETGKRAQAAAQKHKGATTEALEAILTAMDAHVTREPGGGWLAPFTWIYRAGLALDRGRRTSHAPLSAPVVSVGNITTGGTGKTPFVDWITRQVDGCAILTRGYRRQTTRDVILTPGSAAPVAETGDEAQTYLRAGRATVGIGANRRRVAGRMAPPRLFVLDDGFQHWPLPRALDIVLVDATDPFGGGHLLPRGRLREPMAELSRAGLIVLTRAEPQRTYEELRRRLPGGVITARAVAVRWHPGPPPVGPVTAVCGLANPGAFAQTLRQLGLEVERFIALPDHHAYDGGELRSIATPIVTTGKDWAKMSRFAEGLRVHWLEVALELDDASRVREALARAEASRK
jgi:3-deoxy-D-manno-octulosonic-acid transferase